MTPVPLPHAPWEGLRSGRAHRRAWGRRLAALVLWTLTLARLDAATAGANSGATSDWTQERKFWSFQEPRRHLSPPVRHVRWPQQPLDPFILARLESEGLTPGAAADRHTLLRRVTFDLTGLPPTPEEMRAYDRDGRRDPYERWVDRLLASPRFGERLASLWLPLARYGEDQAHQVGDDTKFFYPNAFKYRQWVIEAFNRDLPYDQFLRLQLAADQIEGTNSANLAALGFLGLGPKYYNRGRLDVMADEWEDRVDTVSRAMLGLTVACARCHDHKFEPITMRDYYALAGVFASTRMVNRKPDGREDAADKSEKMDPGVLHVVEDGSVQNLNVFLRGNVDRKGPLVERGYLQVLSGEEGPATFQSGSGRRDLADRIAARSNPLAARVMVNRIWGLIFGVPLVVTPSNFGHSGQGPTHPDLLDDLAARFMENGWSVKQLVREMVLSATYRQSAQIDPRKAAIDPSNRFLWRMNRRRLTVEQWRDAVLFVTGELEDGNGRSLELDHPDNRRRTVYSRISRLKLDDVLMQFDYPDANVHAEKRSVTTTAPQKLFLLNSPFMLERARALAVRLTVAPGESERDRIRKAYRLLYGRDPSGPEIKVAQTFLAGPSGSPMHRWEQYSQVLLVANEMLYVD